MDEAEVTGYISLLQWPDFVDIELKNKPFYFFFYICQFLPCTPATRCKTIDEGYKKCNINFNSSAE